MMRVSKLEKRHKSVILIIHITASAADIVEFHPSFCGPLLRLEKHRLVLAAARAKLVRPWQRWIRCHVLSDTGSVSDLVVEFVLVDTIRGRGLADLAGSAGEHQRVVDAVFLWIEKVGAFTAESEVDVVDFLFLLRNATGRRRTGGHLDNRS